MWLNDIEVRRLWRTLDPYFFLLELPKVQLVFWIIVMLESPMVSHVQPSAMNTVLQYLNLPSEQTFTSMLHRRDGWLTFVTIKFHFSFITPNDFEACVDAVWPFRQNHLFSGKSTVQLVGIPPYCSPSHSHNTFLQRGLDIACGVLFASCPNFLASCLCWSSWSALVCTELNFPLLYQCLNTTDWFKSYFLVLIYNVQLPFLEGLTVLLFRIQKS